jgi:hypothetical protein
MSTQTHWLFEVPLAHEAVHYGNQDKQTSNPSDVLKLQEAGQFCRLRL